MASGPSLLLSPTVGVPLTSAGRTSRQQRRISFSSPLSKARHDWNIASAVDQDKVRGMTLSFPQQLKKVDAAEASRDDLSGFGTTPEKTEKALGLKRSSGTVGSSTSSTSKSSPSTSSSRNSSSSVAAFPPMSAKASTPYSAGKPSDKGSQAKASSSYPTVAKQAPKPFSSISSGPGSTTASKPPKAAEPAAQQGKSLSLQPKPSFPSLSRSTAIEEKKPEATAPSAFGNLSVLSDSLFTSGGSPDEKSDPDSVGLSLGSPLAANSTPSPPAGPDYRKVLFDFCTKHNPATLHEVDKTLAKYKGREVEMFAKLGKKYNVPSPLDSATTAGASSSTAAFSSTSSSLFNAPAPVAPMPSSSANAPSACGSAAGASSPFGAPAARSKQLDRRTVAIWSGTGIICVPVWFSSDTFNTVRLTFGAFERGAASRDKGLYSVSV